MGLDMRDPQEDKKKLEGNQLANTEFLVRQVVGYMNIAKTIHKDMDLGFIGIPENTIALAGMIQIENIFGNQEHVNDEKESKIVTKT